MENINPLSPAYNPNESVFMFGGPRYLTLSSGILPNNNFTISFRFKATQSGTAIFYGDYNDGSLFNSTTTYFSILVEDGIRVRFSNNLPEVFQKPTSGSLLDGNVHYVAVTFKQEVDSASTIVGIFIDGVLTYTPQPILLKNSQGTPMTISGGTMYIATAPPRGQNQEDRIRESDAWSGTMTDLNMWTMRLSADDLVRDVQTYMAIYQDNLCLSLPLDSNSFDYNTYQFLDESPQKINAQYAEIYDGNQGYLFINDTSIFPLQSRTIETWIRCGGTTGTYLVSYGDVSNSDHPNDGGDPWKLTIPNGVSDGQWHHIAVVVDKITNPNASSDLLYIDGQLISTVPSPSPNQVAGGPFYIGTNSADDDHSDFFKGQLKHFRLWSGVRTAAQIQDSFKYLPFDANAEVQNGLKAYWTLVSGENGSMTPSYGTGAERYAKYVERLPNGNLTASETPIILAETELMKNYKHAQVMGEQNAFQALQTAEGHSLFFSIGTDNILYLTKETPGHLTGWDKFNLIGTNSVIDTTVLTPKDFKVSQNLTTGKIDLLLVCTGQKGDFIYTALNIDNADATWGNPLAWQAQPIDAAELTMISVNDIYMLESANGEYMVIDLEPFADTDDKTISRYFLDFSKKTTGKVWNNHDLSLNFDTIVDSCIGKKAGETIEGIYTLGTVGNQYRLIYTPLFSTNTQTIELSLPTNILASGDNFAGSFAIDVATNDDGTTNLFVAGNKNLYFFAANQQNNGSVGQAVDLTVGSLFMNVRELRVHNDDNHVFAWGLNMDGKLFYTECAIGQETQKQAWTLPLPFGDGISIASTYLNATHNNHVLFAYNTNTSQLTQYTQEPSTGRWASNSLVLPTSDTSEVHEVNSFTSHILVVNGSNIPKANTRVAITAVSKVAVYINDIYTILSPKIALDITTDATGNITIIQESNDLSAVCYRLAVEGATTILINPMSKITDILTDIVSSNDTLTSVKKLSAVTIPDDNNNQVPLINNTVTDASKAGVVKAIKQLIDTSQYLPQDGSVKPKITSQANLRSAPLNVAPQTLWGFNLKNKQITFHEGTEATAKLRSATVLVANESVGRTIISNIEHFFSWLIDEAEAGIEAVVDAVVEVVGDVIQFVFTIGVKVFVFVIETLASVVSSVLSFFDAIGVNTEGLRKWFGFVFDFDDMLLTHKVLKNYFKQLLGFVSGQIVTYENQLLDAMTQAEEDIKTWAGLSDRLPSGFGNDSGSNVSAGTTSIKGQHHPAFNMGTYHLKNNVANGDSPDTTTTKIYGALDGLLGPIMGHVEELKPIIDKIKGDFDQAFAEQIHTMTFKEIMVKIIGILGTELLEILKNILSAIFKIFNGIMDRIMDTLDAPIEIPVLSYIYKTKITKGDDLSILDVACLLAAIPITVVFKIVTGKNIFEKGPETDALINAKSFSVFQTYFAKPATPQVRNRAMMLDSTEMVHTPYEKWILATGIMGLIGAVTVSITTALQLVTKKAEVMARFNPVTIVGGVSYFIYLAPSYPLFSRMSSSDVEDWEVKDFIVTIAAMLKTSVDIVSATFSAKAFLEEKNFRQMWEPISPYVECVINAVWLIPAVQSIFSPQNTNESFREGIAGSFFFDFSGILSLPISLTAEPETIEAYVVLNIANGVCNAIYGAVSVAGAERIFNHKD